MPFIPRVLESSDETARHPSTAHLTRRAFVHSWARRQYKLMQRLPLPGSRIKTVGDLREYHRVIRLPDKKGGWAQIHLPDFPRIEDGQANLAWGKVAARDFVESMVSCRRQTQVPACYVAEKMGVAPEIVYRLEGEGKRGIKLDTALRYLYAIGLELEIVEYKDGKRA